MHDAGWYHIGADRGEIAILLFGEFPAPKYAEPFFQELRGIAAPKSVTVYVNSLGGCIYTGFAIANRLRDWQCAGVRIVCEVEGVCGSAATIAAAAADEIRMPSGAFLFLHRAAYVDGRPEDDRLEMMNDAMARRIAEKTGRTRPEVLDLLREEKWLTAAEATSLGFADAIFEEV
jgi:ATP-dependent protease ClpP protease subunit